MISSGKNLYDILEITPNASNSAIKAAYRKLVRKYHPDLNGGDSTFTNKFKEITEAYEILSDAEKKKNYDILRGFYYKEETHTTRSQANKAYKEAQKEPSKKEEGLNKNFDKKNPQGEGFSNIFNDILEGFKVNPKKEFKTKQAYPQKGSDVFSDLTLSLSEAVNGTTKTINILHTEKCPNCEGRKFINQIKCPLCMGSGEQTNHKKISVKIPANVKHGSKIRIANEGNKGYNGGKNGDLYLNIKIENNNFFKFEGLNVLCTIPITPTEAALGASITIPAINGNVVMKILPKTNSGQKFRLNGQGLKGQDEKSVGDMIVTVNIEIPKNLSKRELELYRELADISKEDIRENIKNGTQS